LNAVPGYVDLPTPTSGRSRVRDHRPSEGDARVVITNMNVNDGCDPQAIANIIAMFWCR
jgi:hypothetical protein